MKRVLLIGGYGGFGARITPRLADLGFEVLVAGRHLERATRFCAGRAGMRPLRLDLDEGIDALLKAERPWAVVDAAGPFQNDANYRTARAAIAAGCHYIDIADARAFVRGIDALDAEAKAANVSVISGASSVPALSGAAVRALANGVDSVRAIEIAISASIRATAGASVARAILSYVGRPIRLWRGRRWQKSYGWQEMRREHFTVQGVPPIKGRLVALADIPDLDLLPGRLPGRPAVSFGAGTELAVYNLALWLLSWPVRWRWLRSIQPIAPLILRVQHATRSIGSDRSAMKLRLFGLAGGRRVERRWTLIASEGDGPEIPSLAVPLILKQLADGRIEAGAQDAGELLALEDFEPAFRRLAIRHEIVELEQRQPLYARIMGKQFGLLPEAVRSMHEVLRDGGAAGIGHVRRGRHPAARFIAAVMRFPPEGAHHLHVAFEERDGVERWTRRFGTSRFSSTISQAGPLLVERFGMLRFGFQLRSDGNGLSMIPRRWWIGPLPMPHVLGPRTQAREWEDQDRFHFDVAIALPLIGPVVHYRGWLEILVDEGLDDAPPPQQEGVGDKS